MLVIMDMEWIENKTMHFCPTQISALRVDKNWTSMDRFDALIKPFDSSCHKWKHVAFHGASRDDFLNADPAAKVLIDLLDWVHTDDVLCWWKEESAFVFKQLIHYIVRSGVTHEMKLLHPAWAKSPAGISSGNGSIYTLAASRNLSVPAGKNHISRNDVMIIQALMTDAEISVADVMSSPIDPNAVVVPKNRWKTDMDSLKRSFPLLIDLSTRTVHKSICDSIKQNHDLRGMDTYKACIKYGVYPCSCCRSEFWEENQRIVGDLIKTNKFAYVYAQTGTIFHKPSCIHVKHIFFPELRGAIYYDNCLKRGLRPCGWCKPKRGDQTGPLHLYTSSKKGGQVSQPVLTATRELEKYEKAALKRQAAARKERESLQKRTATMTAQQQKDAYILTQSRFAFWAAVGYQTFHLRNCKKLDQLSGLRGFSKFKDARRAGYLPCKKCKPTSKYDILISVPINQKERPGETLETLDKLCEEQRYMHFFQSPYYFIETPVGKWKLNVDTRPIDVYHINIIKTPSSISYHKQKRLFLSFKDTMAYIIQHELSLIHNSNQKQSDLITADQ